MSRTLAEKVWSDHIVKHGENGSPDLLYIDLQLCHEVTSPQAFEGLRLAGRPVRRPDQTLATEDHNTPTLNIDLPIADVTSRTQILQLRKNCEEFGVPIYSLGNADQGIVHVVGPQLGITQPGMTIVCGDSHTSTTAPSARWLSVLVPRRSSMCSPLRLCRWPPSRRWPSMCMAS